MQRMLTMAYGVLCYAAFLAACLYAFGFIGNILTPTALDAPPVRPIGEAILIDLALVAAFAVQHSCMARPRFKRWWTRLMPRECERSTYVLVSSLGLVAVLLLWEPIGGVMWRVPDGLARRGVIGVYLLGWILLVYATFLIDHFDLFGLRQSWNAPAANPGFKTPALYRLVRHPIYVGWLIIFWAAPVMTSAHQLFAIGMSVYILVAIRWEERDLIEALGPVYVDYRRTTPMLIPRLGRKAGRPQQPQR